MRSNGIPAKIQLALAEIEKYNAAKKIVESGESSAEPKPTSATQYIKNEQRAYWPFDNLQDNVSYVMSGEMKMGERMKSQAVRAHEKRKEYAGRHYDVKYKAPDESRLYSSAKKWRRKRSDGPLRGSCIYLIEGLPSVFKIGKSRNVKSRLSSLQVGSPVTLKLVACIPCKYIWVPEQLEGLLHHHFREHRMHGEWFNLNEESIIEFFRSTQNWVVKYYKPEFAEESK